VHDPGSVRQKKWIRVHLQATQGMGNSTSAGKSCEVPRENLDVTIEKASFKASASTFALHNLKLQVIRRTTTTYNTHNGINISTYARKEDAA
jgi:hypothetical protein